MTPAELYSKIETLEGWEEMTSEQLAGTINDHETVTDNHREIGPDAIMAALGDDAAAVLASLQLHATAGDTGAALLVQQVAASKVDPAGPLARTVIERVSGDWPDGLKDRVLDLGRIHTRLVPEDSLVTADEVSTALAWQTNSLKLRDAKNAATEALGAGSTASEIVAAFVAVFDGGE